MDNVNVVAANVGGVFHTDINIFSVLVGVIDEHDSLATVSGTFFFLDNAFFLVDYPPYRPLSHEET